MIQFDAMFDPFRKLDDGRKHRGRKRGRPGSPAPGRRIAEFKATACEAIERKEATTAMQPQDRKYAWEATRAIDNALRRLRGQGI